MHSERDTGSTRIIASTVSGTSLWKSASLREIEASPEMGASAAGAPSRTGPPRVSAKDDEVYCIRESRCCVAADPGAPPVSTRVSSEAHQSAALPSDRGNDQRTCPVTRDPIQRGQHSQASARLVAQLGAHAAIPLLRARAPSGAGQARSRSSRRPARPSAPSVLAPETHRHAIACSDRAVPRTRPRRP